MPGKVERRLREAAGSDEGGTGIVINAFTEPFVLPKELYEAVERLESSVEEEK